MPEMLNIKGMHAGMQNVGSDEDLTFCRQIGIEYVNASPLWRRTLRELDLDAGHWKADALVRFREHVESFGLKLAAFGLGGNEEGREEVRGPSIIFKTSSERDRDIERFCRWIEAAGKAGIPIILYDWLSGLEWGRGPGHTSGRGGIRYSHFDYEKMKSAPLHPHPVGPISAEQAWEQIEYFIERVIPVAEEYKVKMASHPDDMSVPPGTAYRGITHVLSNIDGLKRFIDLYPSPYHGLLFCQGCIAEFSTNPEQVYEAIRYFGSRKKIFWVHFRNLRGGFLKFEEVFPDEGDIDMAKAMRIYKEVGYDGVLIPDHVPHSDLDTPWGNRARAFCLGYIKALIQAVESEN